ncbi:MAG: hypothetical protein IKZ91_00865 [Bacteroidales bacterium]|nr:hypothetical protein [Bacteroidales bacterium]
MENTVATTVLPGTDLDFLFSLKYNPGIKSARALVDGKVLEGSEKTYSDSPDSVTFSFKYRPSDAYAGNTIDFAVAAEGADGAWGHYDYPVFVLAAKPEITIAFPEDIPNEFLIDGTPLTFDVTITSKTVDMMQVTTYKGNEVLPDMTFPVEGDLRNVLLSFYYEPSLGDTGSPTTFTVEVMDLNGNLVSSNYTVTFTKLASTELNEYNGIVMGLNKCTAAGQFFDAVNNIVYEAKGVGAVCADIDWTIFWSNNANTQGVAFAAPLANNVTVIYPEATITALGGGATDIPANWAMRNETNFRDLEIDADTFAGVSTLQEIIDLFEGGVEPANDHVTFRKAAGATMAFRINRTAASSSGEMVKYGLIRVTARPATNNTGTIVFDYKIEK